MLAALCFVLALCVVFIVAYSIATATAVSYIISTDRGWQNRNWEGARAKCAAEGFILASLYSAEDSRLLKAAAISSDENVWIGANDRSNEGVWVWADGVSMAARGYGQDASGSYERPPWGAGEPNNAGGEHCARFDLRHSSGELNDFSCSAVGAFACERGRWNPWLLLLLLLLLLPCLCYPVIRVVVRCRQRRRTAVAPVVHKPPLKLPAQIALGGAIEFVAAKEGARHARVAFLRAAEATAICVKVADSYAAVLEGAPKPWPTLYVEGHTSSEPNGHADSVRVSKARAELCAQQIRRRLYELRGPGCLAWLRLRRQVVSVGYGASRPLVGSVGQNHRENRRVEMHMRMRHDGAPVKRVQLKETTVVQSRQQPAPKNKKTRGER